MPFVDDEEVEPSSVEIGDEVRVRVLFLICAGMVWSSVWNQQEQATLQTLDLWDCKVMTNH